MRRREPEAFGIGCKDPSVGEREAIGEQIFDCVVDVVCDTSVAGGSIDLGNKHCGARVDEVQVVVEEISLQTCLVLVVSGNSGGDVALPGIRVLGGRDALEAFDHGAWDGKTRLGVVGTKVGKEGIFSDAERTDFGTDTERVVDKQKRDVEIECVRVVEGLFFEELVVGAETLVGEKDTSSYVDVGGDERVQTGLLNFDGGVSIGMSDHGRDSFRDGVLRSVGGDGLLTDIGLTEACKTTWDRGRARGCGGSVADNGRNS